MTVEEIIEDYYDDLEDSMSKKSALRCVNSLDDTDWYALWDALGSYPERSEAQDHLYKAAYHLMRFQLGLIT